MAVAVAARGAELPPPIEAALVESLDLASLPVAAITYLRVQLGVDPLSEALAAPVMVARGAHAGPVVGIMSAVHGNELNGIPVLHRLFRAIDPSTLAGTIVGVPVVNVAGYARYTRGFSDGVDLNRIMPGKKGGSASQQYAAAFVARILRPLDVVLDLHTASFGRVNSHYVRADLNERATHRLALLQNSQVCRMCRDSVGGRLRSLCTVTALHDRRMCTHLSHADCRPQLRP